MYYYYYYYYHFSKENKIEINFRHKEDDKVNFAEFNEFLNSINELHRCIVYLTQPEYRNPINLQNVDDVALVEYHSLKLEKINRENPFFLNLCFDILNSNYSLYWTIWKILMDICHRYGKNDQDLMITIERLFDFYKKHDQKAKRSHIDDQISKVLDEHIDLSTIDSYKSKVYSIILAIITDKKKMKYYNFFCKNSLFITKVVSKYQDMEDIIIYEKEINLI